MFSAYIDDGYAIESKRSLTASLGESDLATGTATSCLQTRGGRTASPSRHEVREYRRRWRRGVVMTWICLLFQTPPRRPLRWYGRHSAKPPAPPSIRYFSIMC